MAAVRRWCNRKVVAPVKEVLSGGIKPSALALSIGLGVAAGVTSVVAVLFMVVLPCNGVIVQVINLLLTPIDVMLVPTYMSVGGWLMSAPATLSPSQFIAAVKADVLGALWTFKDMVWHGVVGWLVTTPVLVLLLWAALTPVCAKLLPKRPGAGSKPPPTRAHDTHVA